VEDDGIVAMDIESRLKKLGYSISGTVIYGEKAIEKVEELKPDMVLMDIVLKGEMDGIEAAEIIRARFDIPVVFLTADADEERFERAKLAIPFGYILKPFQDRDLKITIELALYTAKADAERKRAEKALRESEENLAITLNSIGVAYLEGIFFEV
jgi:CheY-like chemotaxis protein